MNTQKIGLLGGIGPQATGYFYSSLITKLKNSGKINNNADFPNIDYINSDVEQLEQIGSVIENYNRTGEIQSNLSIITKIILDQKFKGVDRFLTACTELSELLNHDITPIPLLTTS